MAKLNYNRPNNGYEREPWNSPKNRDSISKQTNKNILKQQESLNDLIRLCSNFISGKHQGKNIGSVIKQDIKYIEWVLENNPTGVVAKQIIKHFNR